MCFTCALLFKTAGGIQKKCEVDASDPSEGMPLRFVFVSIGYGGGPCCLFHSMLEEDPVLLPSSR